MSSRAATILCVVCAALSSAAWWIGHDRVQGKADLYRELLHKEYAARDRCESRSDRRAARFYAQLADAGIIPEFEPPEPLETP